MATRLGALGACLLLVLTMLPAASTASHNSVGVHANIAHPGEVDRTDPGAGTLAPDVPPKTDLAFHPELPVPRPPPLDQTGQRYTDCSTWESYGGSVTAYQADLRTGEACYLGYLDGRLEYAQFTQIFAIHRAEDLTYRANPTPGDDVCNGRQDPQEHTGVPAADQALTRLQRAGSDGRCDGGTHDQALPGYVMVDPGLLHETAAGGAPPAGAGSPPLALPLVVTPYLFLFGQPHPDNPEPSDHQAGQGPFGPSPAAGGNPLTDLSGACGDRTRQCRLLTPADVRAYDRFPAPGDTNQARVCHYTPSVSYEHPKPESRAPGPCGPMGRAMDQFLAPTQLGGFGLPGAPATWVNTLPGWYRAAVLANGGEVGTALDVADEHVDASALPTGEPQETEDLRPPLTGDADGRIPVGLAQAFAVNPLVPTPDHPLWCVFPNVLATGDDSVVGVTDPGVYGTYRADGLDLDLHRPLLGPGYGQALATTHPTARPHIATVEDAVAATGDPATLLEPLPLPPAIGQALAGALDRAQPLEAPDHDTPDTPRSFERSRPSGLSCTPDGTLEVLAQETTHQGGLHLDVRLKANTANDDQLRSFPQPPGVALKDPTGGQDPPPSEQETRRGGWWTDLYSAHGTLQAVLDTDGDGSLDDCEARGGDTCLWRGLWDAYNPSCTDLHGTPCETLLADRGYDVATGVGLYMVLRITGPVLVVDEDRTSGDDARARTHLVGADDPTGQHCLVATTIGLAPRLAQALSVAPTELAPALCGPTSGETLLVTDGFDDQTAIETSNDERIEPGLFSLAIQWARPLATPKALEDATGLGAGDEVCIHAVLNADSAPTTDTAGHLDLVGANTFTDCDPLQGHD